MTRERNVALGSICLWGVLLFLFGGMVLTYQSWYRPAPEEIVYPWEEGYEAYRNALAESTASSLTLLLGIVVSIVALYKLVKGVSKWYVMGDRQPQPVDYHTVDL